MAEQEARIEAAARRVEAVFGAQFITVECARRDFDTRPLLPRVGVMEDDRRVAGVEDDRLGPVARDEREQARPVVGSDKRGAERRLRAVQRRGDNAEPIAEIL